MSAGRSHGVKLLVEACLRRQSAATCYYRSTIHPYIVVLMILRPRSAGCLVIAERSE